MNEPRRFGASSTASDVIAGHDLTGCHAIVTGGVAGIGIETARALAGAGASVVLAARAWASGDAAARRLREETGNASVRFEHLDLASLSSVRAFVSRYLAGHRTLHLLINNAGVMACPFSRTEDGFESQFGINHLGHFTLTTGLLPALRASQPARVVNLSSIAHRRADIDFEDPNYDNRTYDPWQAYGQSKTANTLFAVALTNHYAQDGVTSNAVMPGTIMTGLQRHMDREMLVELGWVDANGKPVAQSGWKTPQQGAATSVWAAVTPELNDVGGRYLEDCAIAGPWREDATVPTGYLPQALDPDRAERLWLLSEELTKTQVGNA